MSETDYLHMSPGRNDDRIEIPCAEPGCDDPAIGVHVWKAIDMNIGVAYCEAHNNAVRAKLELAGRMAGGATIQDLRN